MIRRALATLLIPLAFAATSLSAQAAEPTLHEVYQAADSGQLEKAQSMMGQVLKEHPNSAKAHFVQAELLARQGRMGEARTELQRAEVLAPGLPFAQPHAVQELRAVLARPASATPSAATHVSNAATATAAPASSGSFGGAGWGLLLMGAGLVFAAIVFLMRPRPQPVAAPAYGGGYGAGYGGNGPAYGPAYGGGPVPSPAPGGGMGSGILGGLATGAAVGAGMVAGQALMHRVMGDETHPVADAGTRQGFEPLDDRAIAPPANYDMGGNDFGVNDAGSWDDGGGDSNDWN